MVKTPETFQEAYLALVLMRGASKRVMAPSREHDILLYDPYENVITVQSFGSIIVPDEELQTHSRDFGTLYIDLDGTRDSGPVIYCMHNDGSDTTLQIAPETIVFHPKDWDYEQYKSQIASDDPEISDRAALFDRVEFTDTFGTRYEIRMSEQRAEITLPGLMTIRDPANNIDVPAEINAFGDRWFPRKPVLDPERGYLDFVPVNLPEQGVALEPGATFHIPEDNRTYTVTPHEILVLQETILDAFNREREASVLYLDGERYPIVGTGVVYVGTNRAIIQNNELHINHQVIPGLNLDEVSTGGTFSFAEDDGMLYVIDNSGTVNLPNSAFCALEDRLDFQHRNDPLYRHMHERLSTILTILESYLDQDLVQALPPARVQSRLDISIERITAATSIFTNIAYFIEKSDGQIPAIMEALISLRDPLYEALQTTRDNPALLHTSIEEIDFNRMIAQARTNTQATMTALNGPLRISVEESVTQDRVFTQEMINLIDLLVGVDEPDGVHLNGYLEDFMVQLDAIGNPVELQEWIHDVIAIRQSAQRNMFSEAVRYLFEDLQGYVSSAREFIERMSADVNAYEATHNENITAHEAFASLTGGFPEMVERLNAAEEYAVALLTRRLDSPQVRKYIEDALGNGPDHSRV